MTNIHYLVLYQPALERVPLSVFFVADPAGTVRGLYFGHAGSGTFEEAYFRMETAVQGVERFLECDNPEDHAFIRDRARETRRRLPPLSPADQQTFDMLCSHRRTWWTFEEGDDVRMDAARIRSMQPVDDGLLCAQSAGFDQPSFALIRRYWSLSGF